MRSVTNGSRTTGEIVAATPRSLQDFERTIFALLLHTIYVVSPFSLMQLLHFFHVTQSDQSAQKGNNLFSKILVDDHCAHRKTGLARRNRQSFDGDGSPGDRFSRVLPAGQARLSVLHVAW